MLELHIQLMSISGSVVNLLATTALVDVYQREGYTIAQDEEID